MSTEHASCTSPDMTEIEHLLGKSADAITPDDIATLQLQLKVVGTYGGSITGIVDANTIYAIKWFRFFWWRENIDNQGRISDRLDKQAAASFPDLLRAEVPEIDRARPQALQRKITTTDPFDAAHETRLAGLAFSGGGIRSATFNLGVLQALAELKLLHVFDYLSTVSGGGYIGSWLSAFIKRRAEGDPDAAAAKILPACHRSLGDQESPAIRFLRSYSNYLTPRLGVLSADTLAAIATYLRNLYLNLLILTLFLAAFLMVPRIVGSASRYIKHWTYPWSDMPDSFVLYGVALLLFSAPIIGANLGYQPPRDRAPFPWFTTRTAIVCLFWLPGFVGAYIVAYWFNLQHGLLAHPVKTWMIAGATIYFMMWLVGAIGYAMGRVRSPRRRDPAAQGNLIPILVTALAAGAVGGLLFFGFVHLLEKVKVYFADRSAAWLAAGFGTIVVLKLLSLVVALHVGLMGRRFSDGVREWWSRLGGLAIAFGIGWLALFMISIFAVPVINYLSGSQGVAKWIPEGALGTWIAATLSGVLLGKGPATGTKESNRALEFLARIAPYIFVLGLLTGIALLVHYLLPLLLGTVDQCDDAKGGSSLASVVDAEFCVMNAAEPLQLVVVAASAFGLGLLLSWRVDINLFSLHNFYRFRLTRCYLGATRARERQPQPFTAFDEQDDLPLHELYREPAPAGERRWQRPYHIVNTALNIVHGQALEWQQRKAASFVFTPLLSGFELPPTSEADTEQLLRQEAHAVSERKQSAGERDIAARGCYRPTARSMAEGVNLGSALAISGAAASPSMGYHSSPALAFLLTVFNVRLGRWCGNPTDPKAWEDSGPGVAAKYLYDELVGNTTSTARYVYLSDGGHFENLGIYELVRRRCRFILASDAGQDANLQFEDLGNAIRKCHVDFGIPIEIDVSRIRTLGDTKRSEWRCAVGAIRYDLRDRGALPGVLLYLKPSLVGDEPADILQYAGVESTFPHQSTGDQWFGESQFESYRKLGYHIAKCVLAKAKEMAEADQAEEQKTPLFSDVEGLIVALTSIWHPPAKGGAAAFTRHAATLDAIYERLRNDPQLRFLDAQIYPNWKAIVEGAKFDVPLGQWLPTTYGELREGFYLCNGVMQLMENVYLDLELETQCDHPDNRGWMNLFRHWAWCNMFRVTWAMSAATYGARFQSFCKRQLGLELGAVEIHSQDIEESGTVGALNFLERNLVSQLLEQHKDLRRASLDVDRIEVVVRNPQDERNSIRLPVGMAITVASEVVFFRIQDHLRRMGLARVALRKLIRARKVTRTRPLSLVKPALETVGEGEQRRFESLFRSVLYELDKR